MSGLERLARRTLFVPVAAVRPYLVLKSTLLLLGFDLWLTRLPHGGRYGAGGFNVAHFEWLDALQGHLVSPTLYVGLVSLTGLLCVVLGLAPRAPRGLVLITFLLHTWSWAMSMLDSYQHHYLLSLVLLALAFFPRLTAEDALGAGPARPIPPPEERSSPPPEARKRGRRSHGASPSEPKKNDPRPAEAPSLRALLAPAPTIAAWAYAALSASTAIVYGYTAYAKTADEWLAGAALRRLLRLPEGGGSPAGAADPIAVFRDLAAFVGLEGQSFWWMMGHSVVLVQIVCAAGYLLAPFRDVTRSLALRAFSWIALATALSFHFGAEYMELKIGWFSAYMILYALIFFLPARLLCVLARVGVAVGGVGTRTEVLATRIGLAVLVAAAAQHLDSWALRSVAIALVLVTPLRLVLHAVREEDPRVPLPAALAASGVGAILLVVVGSALDLPGADVAGMLGACALALGAVALLVARGHARAMHAYGVAAIVAALGIHASIHLSDVRYDFYRNVGGDHRRRGELLTAYRAYVKANRYAPEGQGRERQAQELRRTLQERGLLPPGE